MYFPRDEYERRWRRTYDELRRRGHDTALVWSRSAGTHERCADVLYLTNYYSPMSGHQRDTSMGVGRGFAATLLHKGEEPELIADVPDYPVDDLATERVRGGDHVVETAIEALRERRIEGRVAVVGEGLLPLKYARLLEAACPDLELEWMDDLVETVRRVKSPRELDCYREAGEKASAALQAQMEAAITGGTQADVAAAGAAELMRRGGVPHMIAVSSGRRVDEFMNCPLTGFCPDTALAAGDMVRTWLYGPVWQGYWCDPGRTGIVGRSSSRTQRDLIAAAADIVERLIDAIRPGAAVHDVVALGTRLRERAGTQDDQTGRMFPSFGHGIGLFFEPPGLLFGGGESADETFHAGQTMGVEVFLSRPDVGSAGIEQNVIVGDDGNELLTTTEVEWW